MTKVAGVALSIVSVALETFKFIKNCEEYDEKVNMIE
jgi:hypothetical protein